MARSTDEPGTVAMPADPKPPGKGEVTVPLAQPPVVPRVFVPDPVSGTSRRRRETAQPLDFSRDKTIDRFEMIREIARGGMGQIFLARDVKLGRKVAIKFLLRDDPQFLQRFLVEARATARCTHENIVTIFEVGEHKGLPYMVLEYLEGKTLSEVLETKPSVRQFFELMVPVARALERAHEHGIVHRDLKPSNIFVTTRGQVKVLDFGVARLVDRDQAELARAATAVPLDDDSGDGTFTRSSLVGTLPYMSPEQYGAGAVDHLTDIWALGIMFWRALTSTHPAGTTAPAKLRARILDPDVPLPSIATRDASLPREIVEIVDRCLAKQKSARWQSANELLAAMQSYLSPDRVTGDVSPYRGLAAFGEQDAKYFFGRSNEIRTALSQLDGWPLLAVIGPSGVGKSSFVHAGLVPAMRATAAWQVRMLRPGRAPLQRLDALLEELATGESRQDLAAGLVEAPGLFGATLRHAAETRNTRFLVIVDQLEELFTLCEDDDARRLFLAALLAAADDAASPVRVVLSMRADFLDRLAGHKQFLSEISRGLFFLTAPDQENLRETLVRPAELAGYGFEDPAIVEDMMHVATSRGALPLLSFAASRLWEARDRQKKQLTRVAYQQMGGVGGAFARHADQIASAVAPQNQLLLRAIMTRLVTPDGTRAVIDQRELLSLADPREVERILDHLVRARLVHMETDAGHGVTVEIVHEMLITEWPTLKRWLDDSHAMRAFTHELRQAAKQWVARGKPSDLVWRGATAQEALGHARRYVLDLSQTETDFLAAIKTQAARARRRRVLAFSSILVALGLVFAGGSVALVRIKSAESVAQEKAQQAEIDRKAAVDASGQLRDKITALEAANQARDAAEDATKQAEQRRIAAEQGFAQSEELSREQLEHQVVLAKAAQRKAEEERQHVVAAIEQLKTAKNKIEELLAKEHEARLEVEERMKVIATSLRKPEGK